MLHGVRERKAKRKGSVNIVRELFGYMPVYVLQERMTIRKGERKQLGEKG